MTAQDILLSLEHERLEVWKVPDGKIAVSYENCEVKSGAFLIGKFGTGNTFAEACEDYLNQLHGKTLVFNAYGQRRKEIRVL